MSTKLRGLESAFKASKIEKKCDFIVVLVHWILTFKNKFRGIGLGKEKTFTKEQVENANEALPDGWNAGQAYSIRYVYINELYILSSNKTDDVIIINLLRYSPNAKPAVKSISIDLEENVKEMTGSIKQMIPDIDELITTIQTELIGQSTEVASSSGIIRANSWDENIRSENIHDPLRIGPPRLPRLLPGMGEGDMSIFSPDGNLSNRPAFPPPFGPRFPNTRFYPYGPDNDEFKPPRLNF